MSLLLLLQWNTSLIPFDLFSLCIHAIAHSQTKWNIFSFKAVGYNSCVFKWHILPSVLIRAATISSTVLPFCSFYSSPGLMCHKLSVVTLLGCNYTADDVGWLTSAADELSIFCWVRFTSVPLHERCCCAWREKTRSWIIHLILCSKQEEAGRKPPSVLAMTYQEDDVMPRECRWWCHPLPSNKRLWNC